MWFKHKIIEAFVAVESATSNAIRCHEENLESKIAEVVSSEISAEKRLEKLICKLQQSNELAILLCQFINGEVFCYECGSGKSCAS